MVFTGVSPFPPPTLFTRLLISYSCMCLLRQLYPVMYSLQYARSNAVQSLFSLLLTECVRSAFMILDRAMPQTSSRQERFTRPFPVFRMWSSTTKKPTTLCTYVLYPSIDSCCKQSVYYKQFTLSTQIVFSNTGHRPTHFRKKIVTLPSLKCYYTFISELSY